MPRTQAASARGRLARGRSGLRKDRGSGPGAAPGAQRAPRLTATAGSSGPTPNPQAAGAAPPAQPAAGQAQGPGAPPRSAAALGAHEAPGVPAESESPARASPAPLPRLVVVLVACTDWSLPPCGRGRRGADGSSVSISLCIHGVRGYAVAWAAPNAGRTQPEAAGGANGPRQRTDAVPVLPLPWSAAPAASLAAASAATGVSGRGAAALSARQGDRGRPAPAPAAAADASAAAVESAWQAPRIEGWTVAARNSARLSWPSPSRS